MALSAWGCLPASVRPSAPPPPTPSPSPTPLPTPTPTPAPPTPTPGPTFELYKVRSGDTLTRIAKRFKTDARSISYWNRGRYKSLDPEALRYRPDSIKVGWTLKIMRGQTYVPPPDDGESGEQYTPPPEDLDPEDPTTSPSTSPSPSG
jgi:LysM repeat protein